MAAHSQQRWLERPGTAWAGTSCSYCPRILGFAGRFLTRWVRPGPRLFNGCGSIEMTATTAHRSSPSTSVVSCIKRGLSALVAERLASTTNLVENLLG